MSNENIQAQIDAINQKLDIVLDEVRAQKQSRESIEDLVTDVSVIGKDVFQHSVAGLEKAGIELDPEELTQLGLKFIRNLNTFSELLSMLESANDLMKDLSPIINQVGLDAIQKMSEFEQKGYFAFINELMTITDNIIGYYSLKDVRELADNIVSILETVKSMTQPDMLQAINNALTVYKSMDTKDIPEYSIWKAMRAMNSSEMKKGIGFMITFLKNMAQTENKINN